MDKVPSLITLLVPLIGMWNSANGSMFESESIDPPAKMIIVEAFDAETKGILQHFILDFSSCGFKVYESSESGRFSMNAPDSFACYVQISKPGYARTDLLIDVNEVMSDRKTFKVYLARSSNIYTLRVRDARKQNRYIPEASIKCRSLLDDNLQEVESGLGGKAEILCQPQHRYVLEVKHPLYAPYRAIIHEDELGHFDLEDVFLQPVKDPDNDQSRWTSGKIVDHRTGDKSLHHFSIQVGATSNPLYDLSAHQSNLSTFGKVYLQDHGSIYRIKVGRYYTRQDAEQAVEQVRNLEGYSKAYITQTIPEKETIARSTVPAAPMNILIRLASYQNSAFFDKSKVAHLGEVDLLTKEPWKIAIIRGFKSIADAQQACKTAQELGFTQAHLVEESGEGLLKKIANQ